MKKIQLLSLLSVVVLSACANGYGLIKEHRDSARSDVFQELAAPEALQRAQAGLRVTGALKTHAADSLAPADSHGSPDYRLLVNIDGQAVQLAGALTREDREPQRIQDAEAGSGIRYRFTKQLALKPGSHRLVVALPDDQVAIARELELKEGLNTLEVEPVYGQKTGAGRPRNVQARSFSEGIRSLKITLNGRVI